MCLARANSSHGKPRKAVCGRVSQPCCALQDEISILTVDQWQGPDDDDEPPRNSHRAVRRQGGRLCFFARRCRNHATKLPGADIVRFTEALHTDPAGESLAPRTRTVSAERNPRANNATSKYQFMEMNLQRRMAGLKDKIPDIQKTLDTVQFMKLRKVWRMRRSGREYWLTVTGRERTD